MLQILRNADIRRQALHREDSSARCFHFAEPLEVFSHCRRNVGVFARVADQAQTHHQRQHDGIGNSVGNVEKASQCVGCSVHQSDRGIDEGHPGHGAGQQHAGAGRQVIAVAHRFPQTGAY